MNQPILSAGYDRLYDLSVPVNYDPSKPIGIVFIYHGGSTPQASFGREHRRYADYYYWIVVSMRTAEQIQGWDFYNFELVNNVDAQYTLDVYNHLSDLYQIDSNRIFLVGHSNGAIVCQSIAQCLPDWVAAICAFSISHSYINPPGYQYAWMRAYDPVNDPLINTESLRASLTQLVERGINADFYEHQFGHGTPRGSANQAPLLVWEEMVGEFCLRHPKNFQSERHTPLKTGSGFRDEFDGPALVPSRPPWLVEPFGTQGILDGGGVYGQRVLLEDGYARNEPFVEGLQGYNCWTNYFLPKPSIWRTGFIIDSTGEDLELWPVLLRDMSGKVLSLTIKSEGWEWNIAATSMAFRSKAPDWIQPVSHGDHSFQLGTPYYLEFHNGLSAAWQILDSGFNQVAGGVLSGSEIGMLESQHGFGLRGSTGTVRFDFVEVSVGYGSDRFDAKDLLAHKLEERAGEPRPGFLSTDFHPDGVLDAKDLMVVGGAWHEVSSPSTTSP